MQLVIDIGNTRLKFAIFKEQLLMQKGYGIDELRIAIAQQSIAKAMIASVTENTAVANLLEQYNIRYSVLSSTSVLPYQNLYQSPETIGSDRLAIAAQAHAMIDGGGILAIGAGTCITYDYIDTEGYHGGAISPGIEMRFNALHHYTARLPLIDWSSYSHRSLDTLIGTDTERAILTGVLNGVIQEIEGTIEQYKERYSPLKVVVTGGNMDFLVKNLKNSIFAAPEMILEGLNYILLHDA